MAERKTRCADCELELGDEYDQPERRPCPNCGSLRREHFVSASLTLTVAMSVRATVERLAGEGASDEEISEAIRKESPELAEAVTRTAPERPAGWSFAKWAGLFLAAYMAALATYNTFFPDTPPPPTQQIVQIVEVTLTNQPPPEEGAGG